MEWATTNLIDAALGAVAGHADIVRSVTTATVAGRAVAVTGPRPDPLDAAGAPTGPDEAGVTVVRR